MLIGWEKGKILIENQRGTLGVIPARGGSKSIPKKNLQDVGGIPLLAWTIKAAKEATRIDKVIVSTDDREIANVAVEFGAEVPFLRPSELADDTSSALGVLQHALSYYSEKGQWSPESIIYLQPTSPFRNSLHIDEALTQFENRHFETLVSVMRVPHNMTPNSLMVTAGENLDFYEKQNKTIFRRQDKHDHFFARNGPAILVNRKETILKGFLYGSSIGFYEMNKLNSLDVDDWLDLSLVRAMVVQIKKEFSEHI
jgi:CMP-N-acetylneuraminic acid synthetase